MKEIRLKYEEAINDYPVLINKMINELFLSKKDDSIKLGDIQYFYYWAILDIDMDDDIENIKHLLKFDDRLNYEMNKLTIEIYIKHQNYIRGEIVDNFDAPKIIKDQIEDLIIRTMIYEQYIYKNDDVSDSIPRKDDYSDLYPLLYKNVKKIGDPDNYDLDQILDKISSEGYDSLTTSEKNYLKNIK